MELHTRYHQQDTHELSTHNGIVLVYPLDKTLLCRIPCTILFGNERSERGENHLAKDLGGAFRWFCVLFPQLVAIGVAYR